MKKLTGSYEAERTCVPAFHVFQYIFPYKLMCDALYCKTILNLYTYSITKYLFWK